MTEVARAEPVCMDAAMREQVRGLMLDGLDQALKNHVGRLFDVWVKDRADEPRRAIAGTQAAVNGYVRSRAAAMRWTPPACAR